MKNNILDASGNKALLLPIDAAISFTPFIEYMKQRAAEETTIKGNFYRTVLHHFEEMQVAGKELPIEEMKNYEALLQYMYASNTPPLANEKELAWGLSFPFQPYIFYGTDMLYELLERRQEGHDVYEMTKTPEEFHRDRLQLVYSFILKRLYDFESPVKSGLYHSGINTVTGLLEYYTVNVNTDFITVTHKGELPTLDCDQLYMQLSQGAGFEILESTLPLDMFQFRGIAICTIKDITPYKAVDNIRRVRLTRNQEDVVAARESVIRSLKTLVRTNKIEFDLFPLVRINNEPVYGFAKSGTGVLFAVWGEDALTPEEFKREASGFAANPNFFFSPDIYREAPSDEYDFLERFRQQGVRSLALFPVFFNHALAGVLGMHTWGDDTFDEKTLALLEPALAPVGQLLQIYIDEFNLEIENIVKEKFTSLQPAVQWKFNEAAWHYLQAKSKNLPTKTEHVHFNDVYPLYGAIDIRNSTVERNNAVKADLDSHLRLLTTLLTDLHEKQHSSLLEEAIFTARKWQQVVQQEQLTATDETNLNYFLTEGTVPYLKHLAQQQPATRAAVDAYVQLLHQTDGELQEHRHALELSMQTINSAINNYFETEKHVLQQSYPCYFEKFRSDGIEYDIYIGQSIAPDKPFDHFHLKHLRLWQLSSMAAITKLTRELLPTLAVPLQTTQLIFAHNHTIDISFRADERRFDVEGTYNIRYQMIKKRIDKVHIRNTNERLTQPDKLALIYFSRKDVDDYLPFMQYLQETGVLKQDMEELELEDLQGLSGLKALRVTVA
ncbi:GAF domain-containing protein [Chitinophaga agrisoli]|uniref:GAF domain-containing protein n=1 Tax=Chitinophaga agrisoli TaxID=2607653 RepID=A0A5B2VM62_9BACT|nr:GAF domain-containing protein [Chitinophaga agrisoli]KAA2239944.1 GAF domain-containing protein [Chitinophaga agrisoli]